MLHSHWVNRMVVLPRVKLYWRVSVKMLVPRNSTAPNKKLYVCWFWVCCYYQLISITCHVFSDKPANRASYKVVRDRRQTFIIQNWNKIDIWLLSKTRWEWCKIKQCKLENEKYMMTSSMETFSALRAICAKNSPVTGEFPAQRPVTRSSDVFFDLRWLTIVRLVIWDATALIMTSQ